MVTAVSASSTRIPAPAAGSSAQRQGIGSTVFQVATPTPKAANVAGATSSPCGPVDGGSTPPGGSGGPPASPAGAGGAASKGPVLAVKGASTLTVKGGVVSVQLGCVAGGATCSGRATLTATGSGGGKAAKTTTLGSAAVKIAAGRTATVRIKLNAAATKLLKKSRRLKARLTVTLAGAPPIKRTVSLKRSR